MYKTKTVQACNVGHRFVRFSFYLIVSVEINRSSESKNDTRNRGFE